MGVTNQQLHDRLKDIVASLRLIADRPRTIVVPSGHGPDFRQVTDKLDSTFETLSAEMALLLTSVESVRTQTDQLEGYLDTVEAKLNGIEVNTDQASGSGESIAQLLEKFQDKRVNDWLGQMDGYLATIDVDTGAIASNTGSLVTSNAAILVTQLVNTIANVASELTLDKIEDKLARLWPIDEGDESNLIFTKLTFTNGDLTQDFVAADGAVHTVEGFMGVSDDSTRVLTLGYYNTTDAFFAKNMNINVVGGNTQFFAIGAAQIAILKHMRFDNTHMLRGVMSGVTAGKTIDIYLITSREIGSVD